MFANKRNEIQTNAHVVDGKLILSFPEAITPIVWQIDLSDAKSSSFEVVEEGGRFSLVTKKSGAQKKETIAPFADRDTAVKALMATSYALSNAHGQIQGSGVIANTNMAAHPAPMTYAAPPAQAKGGAGKWIFAIASVVLIIGLFSMLNTMQPRSPSSMGGASNTASGQGAEPQSGVPVSADDFLRTR